MSHKATTIVYLKRRRKDFVSAYLIRLPNRAPRKIDFEFKIGGDSLITMPFRTLLQEEMDNLERTYREALMDADRRDAFDSLLRAWSSEQGAMSYARVPTALDVMLLTAVVDNRRLIEDLFDQIGVMRSQLQKIDGKLEKLLD